MVGRVCGWRRCWALALVDDAARAGGGLGFFQEINWLFTGPFPSRSALGPLPT